MREYVVAECNGGPAGEAETPVQPMPTTNIIIGPYGYDGGADTVGQTIGNMVADGIQDDGLPSLSNRPIDKVGLSDDEISNLINSHMPILNDDGSVAFSDADTLTVAHKLGSGHTVPGMAPDDRRTAFETAMTNMGATKNADGTYTLEGDTIRFDNRYLADKPRINESGGSEFDPNTAVYKDTRDALEEFLSHHVNDGYGEVRGLSALNSKKSLFLAGSIDQGWSGTMKISYADLMGSTQTYTLPSSQEFTDEVWHEIGHAVYGFKPEIDADSFALGRMGLAKTWPSIYRPIELHPLDVQIGNLPNIDLPKPDAPKIAVPKPVKSHPPKRQ